jgi:SAM-dependent methyltransferase
MIEVPDDWWRTFFSGVAVDAWLRTPTKDQTEQEADFIQKSLQVAAPARLLDVPCGGGRHCHVLAGRGYDMTGVDISPEFLNAARSRSAGGPGRISWEQREMRDLPWPEGYDGAYCFGNSFGYLDEDGNAGFLKSVARALKPGARFVLDTSYIAEVVLPGLQERSWYPAGDLYWLAQRRYEPALGRLYVEYVWLGDGKIDKRAMSARLFTCREALGLVEGAGFIDLEAHGGLSGEPFRLGSSRLLLVAKKKP